MTENDTTKQLHEALNANEPTNERANERNAIKRKLHICINTINLLLLQKHIVCARLLAWMETIVALYRYV